MNSLKTIPAAVIALLLACSWSGEQERILSAFNHQRSFVEKGNWDSLMTCLTMETRSFIDSLSENLTSRGLCGYDSSSRLLETLCSEYIDFGEEVTVIFVQEGEAELTVTSALPGSFSMKLEGDEWKLNLESVFRGSLDEALRGSYVR